MDYVNEDTRRYLHHTYMEHAQLQHPRPKIRRVTEQEVRNDRELVAEGSDLMDDDRRSYHDTGEFVGRTAELVNGDSSKQFFEYCDQVDGSFGPAVTRKGAKRCTRHAPPVIAHLEAFFKQCPTPNERQRMELSLQLGITVKQVKYWFQNRRTQFRSENSKRENSIIKHENDRLREENFLLRNAIEGLSCPRCGTCLSMIDLEKKQLAERYHGLSEKHSDDRGASLSVNYMINPSSHSTKPDLSCNLIEVDLAIPDHEKHHRNIGDLNGASAAVQERHSLTKKEKDMITNLAIISADEVVKLTSCNESLWIVSTGNKEETLDYEEYTLRFPQTIGPLRDGYCLTASRALATVAADAYFILDSFLDMKCWQDLFPCIITKADVGEVISSGDETTRDGALQLMFAEFQMPSPVVPTRKVYFLRFCKLVNEVTWAIVDVSVDNLRGDSPSALYGYRRRPSGCLIQRVHDGLSKVIWIEHSEFDASIHQHAYKKLVVSGKAFGAQMWLSALKMQCARHAILTTSIMSIRLVRDVECDEARAVALIMLGQQITMQLCNSVKASPRWTPITGSKSKNEERVMIRETLVNPNSISTMVVTAATSVRLPVPPCRVFNFLTDPCTRKEWDVLSLNGAMEEIIGIPTCQESGSHVSLLRPKLGDGKMFILQECRSDDFSSTLVYAPADMISINAAVREVGTTGKFVYNGKPILPSGFIIVPEGQPIEKTPGSEAERMETKGGSLMTVAFQLLISSEHPLNSTVELIQMMVALVCNTVDNIKSGLKCNCPSYEHEPTNSQTVISKEL
ncbi:hypothetical protein KP509_08G001000 [Ceratopteris richardii]|nr:hypothetical protein KP509_08G001000 [Ceratopteris richardii]